MNLVSLSQFLNLTGLSSQDLIALLEQGELPTAFGDKGELLIDISDLSPDKLARQGHLLSVDDTQLEEIITTTLLSRLDPILEEATEMAFRWLSQRKNEKGPRSA